jgi:hypothetical protein
MLGVELAGPAMMFGDNAAVSISTSIPSSQLKKKHNACAFHRIRECVAMKVIDFMHIPSIHNLADVLTKPLGGVTFHRLVAPMLFWRSKLLAFGQAWQANDTIRGILGDVLGPTQDLVVVPESDTQIPVLDNPQHVMIMPNIDVSPTLVTA